MTQAQDMVYYGSTKLRDEFCSLNDLEGVPTPTVSVSTKRDSWKFSVCAYYRPHTGIVMCLDMCAKLAGPERSRNWNWPGSTTDRTPVGVIAHELGHHYDYHKSEPSRRGAYWGNFSTMICQSTDEKPITSYAENNAEIFAEWFRLFVTNPPLLKILRPKVYRALLAAGLKPLFVEDHGRTLTWQECLRANSLVNVPERIVTNLDKKVAEADRKATRKHRH